MFLKVYVCLNPSAKYYRVLLLWLQPFTLTMEARKETRKRKTEKERVILNISTATKMSSQEESTSTGTQEMSSETCQLHRTKNHMLRHFTRTRCQLL
jgi:hypothetical protein